MVCSRAQNIRCHVNNCGNNKVSKTYLTLFVVFFLLGKLLKADERKEVHEALLKGIEETWPIAKPVETNPNEIINSDKSVCEKHSLSEQLTRIIIPKVNLTQLPLSKALTFLTEFSSVYDLDGKGVNFVLIDPEHKDPCVDLNVQSLSLEKILRYISEMTHFSFQIEGNIVVFRDGTKRTLDLRTQVFPVARGSVLQILNYAQSPSVEKEKLFSDEVLLKEFFGKIGISWAEEGVGFAYDGCRIVVTHYPDVLCRIQTLLQQYKPLPQVAIETKFLDVQQGVLEELGFRWNSGKNNHVTSDTTTILRPLSQLETVKWANEKINATNKEKNASAIPKFPNALDFGHNVASFLDANTILNRYQMQFILRAIEQRSDSDLMSTPKVTVLSGRKAEIIVAQELRYPESFRDGRAEVGSKHSDTSSAGTAIIAGVPENFVTRNVGVEMSVIPLVESNDRIHLSLEPCVTELEGFVPYGGSNIITYGANVTSYDSGYYQPVFSTRRIKTEVSLANGATLVMGGLTREEVKETNDKVPIFGSIPLLGKLFTSKGQTSQKRNLLIFVTANLLNEDGKTFSTPELPTQQAF